jgi:peroxiredoxin
VNGARIATGLATVAALLAGCSKSSGAGDGSPSAAASPAPAAAASPSAGSMPTAPTFKESSAPPADRIGILAPNTGIPPGQHVPDVHAVDLEGKDVTLSSLYGKGPILLAFYRGGWCPFCNGEIHALTGAFAEYQRRGVTPVAVSVDKPEAEAKIKATYAIPFPVLSDSDAAIIEAFHVVKKVGDDELAKMKGFGVDLESYSGKTHHEMAIPSLFLIDRKGVVRWAHSDPDFRVRPTMAQILSAIDAAHLDGT